MTPSLASQPSSDLVNSISLAVAHRLHLLAPRIVRYSAAHAPNEAVAFITWLYTLYPLPNVSATPTHQAVVPPVLLDAMIRDLTNRDPADTPFIYLHTHPSGTATFSTSDESVMRQIPAIPCAVYSPNDNLIVASVFDPSTATIHEVCEVPTS